MTVRFCFLCSLVNHEDDRLTLNSWLSPPHSPRRICQADHLISFFPFIFFFFFSLFPLFLRYDTCSGLDDGIKKEGFFCIRVYEF